MNRIQMQDLIKMGKLFWRYRLFLGALTISCMLFGGIKAKNAPDVYRTYVDTLLPDQSAMKSGGVLTKYLGLPDLSVGQSSFNIILYIIKSRRMAEDIVEEFNFADPKDPRSKMAMINTVRNMIHPYMIQDGGGLRIQITGNSPEKLADIANFCVTNLDHINDELELTSRKPMLKWLDAALPPTHPLGKNVRKKAFIAGLFGLFFGMGVLSLKEYVIAFKKKYTSLSTTTQFSQDPLMQEEYVERG